MKTKTERYIESLEDQIDRQRLTIRRLRWENDLLKQNAATFTKKTLALLEGLRIPVPEVFGYYGKKAPND